MNKKVHHHQLISEEEINQGQKEFCQLVEDNEQPFLNVENEK